MNRITGGQIRMDAMLLEGAQQPQKLVCESSDPMVQAIQEKLAERGFGFVKVPEIESTKFKQIYAGSIDPATCGKLASVFKEISVKIEVGGGPQEDGEIVAAIILNYDWQHFRGHNGYRVRWQYENGAWKQWE